MRPIPPLFQVSHIHHHATPHPPTAQLSSPSNTYLHVCMRKTATAAARCWKIGPTGDSASYLRARGSFSCCTKATNVATGACYKKSDVSKNRTNLENRTNFRFTQPFKRRILLNSSDSPKRPIFCNRPLEGDSQ